MMLHTKYQGSSPYGFRQDVKCVLVGVIGTLLAHAIAFGSVELKTKKSQLR